jgi:phosphopantothenoylcysteine decarboxylase / phosphopantothenate---cysteine ligase
MAVTAPPFDAAAAAAAPGGLPGLPLQGRHIVLGLTGGVACYKAAELARELQRVGASVQAVMTEAAQQFITPVTLQALTGRPVFTSQWDPREPNAMAHINLGREADAIVVAPASADFIAQLAQGRAGELLPLLCLARPRERCGLLLAPAMNREMWAHPATQRNVAQVQADGALLLGPAAGDQACGEVGDGRMLEALALCDAVVAHFQPRLLAGRRVLITAGPTFEAIDPVRGITNLSSGKMGFAIARAAAEAGASVTLVAGPVHLPTPAGVRRIDVTSAQQMFDAVLPAAPQHDVFVATAAVADWRPAQLSERKIKKDGSKVAPLFELVENPDILAAVAALPPGQRPYCVGFAAESHDLLRHARAKRENKGVPLIVGNLGPATFGRDDNALLLVGESGELELPGGGARADKLSLARALVAHIAPALAGPCARIPAGRLSTGASGPPAAPV